MWSTIVSFLAPVFESVAKSFNALINMQNAKVALIFLGLGAINFALWLWFGLAVASAFTGLAMIGLAFYFENKKSKQDKDEL